MAVVLLLVLMLGVSPLLALKERIHPLEWTTQTSNESYPNWSASENFYVGDILQFYWTFGTHNVLEVIDTAYDNCAGYQNTTIKTESPVNITLDKVETRYFICTESQQCSLSYMKLKIQVVSNPAQSSPPASPTYSPPASPTSPPSGGKKSSISTTVIVGSVIGSVVVVVLVALVILYACIRPKRKPARRKSVKAPPTGEINTWEAKLQEKLVQKFSYEDLLDATQDFSEKQLLGQGGFGKVYKGILPSDGSAVAVKVMPNASSHSLDQFKAEVSVIGNVRHKNLVSLRGWSHGNDQLLLVYDFMQNGSLDRHLFPGSLPWINRFEIVKNVAEGLHYLHSGWYQKIIHRDIKAANVLLDDKFVAYLGDFGLAKFMDVTKIQQTMTESGTRGYIAPELVLEGKASEKSDVYSFGILLLEIGCGRPALDLELGAVNEGSYLLLDWVWKAQERGALLEVYDRRLETEYDEAQVILVLSLGLLCAQPDPNARPNSRTCSLILNAEIPLPELPSSKPLMAFTSTSSVLKGSSSFLSSNNPSSTISDEHSYSASPNPLLSSQGYEGR